MGDLISFPARPKAAREIAPAAPREAAILFFTGVRYERHIESAPVVVMDAPKGDDHRAGGKRRKRRG